MRNQILIGMLFSSSLIANTQMGFNYNIKDYSNSKTKIDGKSQDYMINTSFDKSKFFLNYETSKVNRENKVLRKSMEALEVEKISLKYNYLLNEKFNLKINYINIEDNLAPTDDGQVYGLGLNYNLDKKHFLKFDQYLSDYDDFNVYQTDFLLGKRFKIEEFSFTAKAGLKYINIDGDKYSTYKFIDKDYLSFLGSLSTKYENYFLTATYMKGDRLFTVLADGVRVQHHAMRQDDTYILSLAKKYNNFEFGINYSYQIGKELPENQDDVKSKVTSVQFKYKF